MKNALSFRRVCLIFFHERDHNLWPDYSKRCFLRPEVAGSFGRMLIHSGGVPTGTAREWVKRDPMFMVYFCVPGEKQ